MAQALDREDFASARAVLALDCIYQTRTHILTGREAILQSYRDASQWGKEHLGQVSFSSSVRSEPDGRWIIRYVDRIEHAGARHTYQCEQVLTFATSGEVIRIVHVELPGQREALMQFFAEVGVVDDRG